MIWPQKKAFTGKKPSIDNLRIWVSHIHSHYQGQKKEIGSCRYERHLCWLYFFIKSLYNLHQGRTKNWSRDVIFDESIAYKESKDITIDFDEQEETIFEELSRHDNRQDPTTNLEEVEGPSELMQQIVVPKTHKRPTW